MVFNLLWLGFRNHSHGLIAHFGASVAEFLEYKRARESLTGDQYCSIDHPASPGAQQLHNEVRLRQDRIRRRLNP